MKTTPPEQVVRQLFDAFLAADVDALMRTIAPDIRLTYVGANPEPAKAVLTGHERVRGFFERILRRLEMSRFEPAEFVVQGDTVVVFGSETGTVRSTGEPFHNEWAQKYEVVDGLVSALTEYNVQIPPRRDRSSAVWPAWTSRRPADQRSRKSGTSALVRIRRVTEPKNSSRTRPSP